MSHEEALLVVRRCKGCGEELRARVRAHGADRDDAIWIAEGLSNIAACPRCERRAIGRLYGAALWDGFGWFFASFVAMSIVSAILGAGFLGSGVITLIGIGLAFLASVSLGAHKAKSTMASIYGDAAQRVFWHFCTQCKKGIVDGRDAWMTCERCHCAVHEPCAMEHATSHVALTAYRGSSSSSPAQ